MSAKSAKCSAVCRTSSALGSLQTCFDTIASARSVAKLLCLPTGPLARGRNSCAAGPVCHCDCKYFICWLNLIVNLNSGEFEFFKNDFFSYAHELRPLVPKCQQFKLWPLCCVPSASKWHHVLEAVAYGNITPRDDWLQFLCVKHLKLLPWYKTCGVHFTEMLQASST